MTTTVQRWGNSLAVRIPRSVAHDTHLDSGSQVDVRLHDGTILIVPTRGVKYQLEKLLGGVRKTNRHSEVTTGAPVGAEVW